MANILYLPNRYVCLASCICIYFSVHFTCAALQLRGQWHSIIYNLINYSLLSACHFSCPCDCVSVTFLAAVGNQLSALSLGGLACQPLLQTTLGGEPQVSLSEGDSDKAPLGALPLPNVPMF